LGETGLKIWSGKGEREVDGIMLRVQLGRGERKVKETGVRVWLGRGSGGRG
jgi:hypothetical protein